MRAADKHPNDPLLLACRRLSRAMDLFDENTAHVLGIGRSDLRALNLLEHGPLSATELADYLGLTRPTLTTLVDRLIEAGYASRTPDPEDRRRIRIALDPSTWRVFARIYRPLGERVQDATGDLAARDRDMVIAALDAMQHAFDINRPALS